MDDRLTEAFEIMMRQVLLAMSRSRGIGRFVGTNRHAWGAASRFVAGRSIDEAVTVIERLNGEGLRATLDHLGENVTSQVEAQANADAYLEAIDRIRAGSLLSGISLKLTALGLDISPEATEALLEKVVAHAAAQDPPVFVRVDMEASAYTEVTMGIFYRLFETYRNLGIVIQSYLYRSDEDIARLASLGAGVRLVKGAYLEPEELAYPEKEKVDEALVRQAKVLMTPESRASGVYTALGTHDSVIIDWAKDYAAKNDIPRDTFEFQMLFGVRRDLQRQLADEGFRVRVYVPYGDQWYPYFMRRLAERPENVAFVLRAVISER
jgi:proline dehydrogenase